MAKVKTKIIKTVRLSDSEIDYLLRLVVKDGKRTDSQSALINSELHGAFNHLLYEGNRMTDEIPSH